MFPVTITLQSAAQLNAVMAALALDPVVAPTKVEAPKSVKAEKPAPTPTAQPTTTATAAPAVTASSETATASPSDPKPQDSSGSSPKPSASVDYPTLQKAVFALAGKSRDAAAAVAGSFGVKTFKELPEAKWAEALVAVNAALEAA